MARGRPVRTPRARGRRSGCGAQRNLEHIGPLLHADLVICTVGAEGGSNAEENRVALEVLPHPLSLFARLISIHIDLFHGFAVTTRGSATRTGKIAQPFLNGAALLGGASANLVRRFYDAAATGGIAPITAGETIAVSRAAEHIQTRMSPT